MAAELKDPLSQVLDPLQFHQGGADLGAMLPAVPGAHGSLTTGMQGDVITAQRCAVPRNMTRILVNLKALASAAGKEYVYGWEVNDRKNNRKVWIEGPTIKLANDLAREYGNCQVDCRVMDEGRHWIFYARFVDLETGFSMVRAYQQRKGQDTGMKDDQRAMDLIFGIGQSKAIRNVVVNALSTLANYCVDAAKGSLLDKVSNSPEKAREWIKSQLVKLEINIKRVEAVHGRTAAHWTVPDMARIYTEIQSIVDGMVNAEDVYPLPDEAEKKTRVESPLAEEKPEPKTKAPPPEQEKTRDVVGETPPSPSQAQAGKPPEAVADAAEATLPKQEEAPAKKPRQKKASPLFGGEV